MIPVYIGSKVLRLSRPSIFSNDYRYRRVKGSSNALRRAIQYESFKILQRSLTETERRSLLMRQYLFLIGRSTLWICYFITWQLFGSTSQSCSRWTFIQRSSPAKDKKTDLRVSTVSTRRHALKSVRFGGFISCKTV